jgi:hypothetical protein
MPPPIRRPSAKSAGVTVRRKSRLPSNRSVAEWGTVFADPVVATAILDRLLHHSHVLTIRGDSYRLRAKRKSGLIKAPTAGDGPPVGSASLRPVTGGNNLQPRS